MENKKTNVVYWKLTILVFVVIFLRIRIQESLLFPAYCLFTYAFSLVYLFSKLCYILAQSHGGKVAVERERDTLGKQRNYSTKEVHSIEAFSP